ncbi:MAG: TraR/DksA C4-type zinc finger protein [Ginsengibacter sp.]
MATRKKATPVAKKSKSTTDPAKKAGPVKKAAPKNKTLKKPVPKVKDKKLAKKITGQKAASKLINEKKSKKIIKKPSPVKKAAKSGVKNAVPKRLATKKKSAVSTPKKAAKKINTTTKKAAPVKKAAAKPIKQKVLKKTVSKPEEKAHDHKAELKKAIAKIKLKKEEVKKPQKAFVMPKTNTEKARKYEPEFTKSVLDQSPIEFTGPTMRYSDSELVEFRELITRKLETAKKELGYLQGLITRKDQMGGDESDNRYMTMEDGSLSMEREQLSQMASRQITFIDHLEKAMMRIENKTYGICRVTGKLIDKARLRAVPHATLSIEAKMGISR